MFKLGSILMIFRHLLSILLMPFVVVVLLPAWLLRTFAGVGSQTLPDIVPAWAMHFAGTEFFAIGFFLFAWCVILFGKVGKGTLAPWDATQKLVSVGPYRHVRNPMITGVASMLIGEALFHDSWVLGGWVCLFVLINHIYFVFSEEPGLERRFEDQYRLYKQNVPRWIPRLKPY